jgi:formiminoglutamase
MHKLPFFVSVPHGGLIIPAEVADRVCITPRDLFDDSDACTRDLYALENHVAGFRAAAVARAFVDLNRDPAMRPPEYPDGVVKSATCYGRPIYREGMVPEGPLVERLLEKYYHPYHHALTEGMSHPGILLGLDCHTMAESAPAVAPDQGRRPLVCLGDAGGEACDPRVTGLLREAFMEGFGMDEEEVTVNDPFRGGFITRTQGNRPKPWIQVELNRSLYLSPPWFDAERLTVNPGRLEELRLQVWEVLKAFYKRLEAHRLFS